MSQPEELWEETLEQLQHQMTRATFDTWLRGTRLVEHSPGRWTVAVKHAYALDWLKNRLLPLIERTAARLAGHTVQVAFVVRPRHIAKHPLGTAQHPPGPRPEAPPPIEPRPPAGPLPEAVREEHVTVQGDGTALVWTDFYIKLKVAFRRQALRRLRGAALAVWLCLALHVDRHGISAPGIETIMEETGYNSRTTVCRALAGLVRSGLVDKLDPGRWGKDRYRIRGYAWFGRNPAPALWEEGGQDDGSPQSGL
jgi:hypothetical protein